MLTFCKHRQLYMKITLGILFTLFFFIMVYTANAANLFNEQIPVIVIDPGHGGNDSGVKGSDGTLEKDITLIMAHLLKDEFSSNYKIILTRNEDYAIEIEDRTAIANNKKASIFISLHAGGSFQHKTSGISIYYFQKSSSSGLPLDQEESDPLFEEQAARSWNNIQLSHIPESKKLSHTIYSSLSGQSHLGVNKTQGGNFSILTGSDMPAIIIELGYLTNPSDENILNNINILKDLSEQIRVGIENYLLK